VILQGTFKIGSDNAVGFAKVLPIQCLILNKVCKDLHTLVVHSIPGAEKGDAEWIIYRLARQRKRSVE
jgi:hypothetical protein